MQPKSQRRVHGAEFKAQVLSECRQPGASVAAVSLAHGLNVNLVRKWLAGRGLKRVGLASPVEVVETVTKTPAEVAAAMRFLPVDLANEVADTTKPLAAATCTAATPQPFIHIALSRGETQLSVQWPAAHAAACGAWLRELAAMPR